VDPDSESGSGSIGNKNEEKNALFLNFLNIFIAQKYIFYLYVDFLELRNKFVFKFSFVDPDPDPHCIRIQKFCGSGSRKLLDPY
jgi:hypothetical protein